MPEVETVGMIARAAARYGLEGERVHQDTTERKSVLRVTTQLFCVVCLDLHYFRCHD